MLKLCCCPGSHEHQAVCISSDGEAKTQAQHPADLITVEILIQLFPSLSLAVDFFRPSSLPSIAQGWFLLSARMPWKSHDSCKASWELAKVYCVKYCIYYQPCAERCKLTFVFTVGL